MQIIFGIYGVIMGAAVSSFMQATIYRLDRKIPVFSKDRSVCDGCARQLKWYENVPIASYLFVGGKSLCCDQKISIRYFLYELIGGVLGGVVAYKSSSVTTLALNLIYFLFLQAIVILDLSWMSFYRFLMYPLVVIDLLWWEFYSPGNFLPVYVACGWLILGLLLMRVGYGRGDVFLYAILALLYSLQSTNLTGLLISYSHFFLALAIGATVTLIVTVLPNYKELSQKGSLRKQAIPATLMFLVTYVLYLVLFV